MICRYIGQIFPHLDGKTGRDRMGQFFLKDLYMARRINLCHSCTSISHLEEAGIFKQ